MRIEQRVFVLAPREAVWRLVAQTDRLNREMGLPPIRFSFEPRAGGGTHVLATVQVAGLTLRYREEPFEWVRPAFYSVCRTFTQGPVRQIRIGVTLEAEAEGTRLVVWAELEPINPLGVPVCKILGARSVAEYVRVCQGFDAYFTERAATPYPRHARQPPAEAERLRQALEALCQAGAEAALARRLADHIASAPPEDLAIIRPFDLADAWGLPRMALLHLCLHAAKTGLLNLRWRVLCPYCRGGPPGASHLDQLRASVHCPTCNLRFDATFDRSVEVCFRVSPSIRRIPTNTYCIGGPELTPHAVVQWVLPPHSRQEQKVDLVPGAYSLTSLQAQAPHPLEIAAEGVPACCIHLHNAGERIAIRLEEEPDRVACTANWTVHNATDQIIILRLEISEGFTHAATAALVTSLQAFRDQFSSQVLSPDTEVAVEHICILFSDLKGSTRLYREQGDAPSYRLVRDHFQLMRDLVAAHNGAIVKTLGDAIMAAFSDPADGLAAALAIQRKFRQEPSSLVVKLGLHWGPALAVNANDRLDYFGQTVNLAARLQQESRGRDIVVAAALQADPHVSALLLDPRIQVEPFVATVRGLEESVSMLRLRWDPISERVIKKLD